MTMCLCTFALSSCAGLPGAEATMLHDKLVIITFDDQDCPQKVSEDDFLVDKKNADGTFKRVVWRKSGGVAGTGYKIFFDPFNGKPHESRNGEVKQTISWMTPGKNKKLDPNNKPEPVQYKYTIVGDACKEKALDPHFRLRG